MFLGGGAAYAVSGAQEVQDGGLPFVAKISIGELDKSCTGALVARGWIVTAKSCFAVNGGAVAAGPPAQPATVVLGRADVTKVTGHRLAVVSLVPHASRNIVLAELSAPVKDITPVALGGAPQAGETLHVAGFGRTGTAWVPNRLHTGDFTVGDVSANTFGVTGAAAGSTLCKGDAGGPAFRDTGSGPQLVGISDTSWQKGCLGEPERTEDGAFEARTDDLADWIRSHTATLPGGLREPVTGEFTRDGIQDLVAYDAAGTLWLYPGTATRNVFADRINIGAGFGGHREFAVGRVNRDNYDDLVTIETATQKQWLYPGTAAGGAFGTAVLIGGGWNTNFRDVAIGKVDRDEYDDLLVVTSNDTKLLLYKGNATGGSFSAAVEYGSGWNCCKQLQIGKFTTDDYDDLVTVETATGAMRLYAGTAAGTQFAPGVTDTAAGTAWNAASYLIKGKFDDTGLDGLLSVEATTGRSYRHPRTAAGGWAPTSPTPQPGELANLVTGKLNRDDHPDVAGVDAAGVLWLYPGTAARTWGPRAQIGTGWGGMRELAVGRVNRDDYDDLVTIETATNLQWLYPGTAAGGAFGTRVQIGGGWTTSFRDVTIGKVDRDAYDDLLVVTSNDTRLQLYKGNATGGSFSAGVQYGSGWNCCKELTTGRFNDDDYDDLLTVETATGALRLYPGTAAGTQYGPGAVDTTAGAGWLNRSNLFPITYGAEARTGLVAKDNTGALLLYPVKDGKAVDWSDPIPFGPTE